MGDEAGDPKGQGSGAGAVDGALRRLLVAERDFDAAADELAASRSEPTGAVEEHAVRTLQSVHRLAMEIEAAARERAAGIERQAREHADAAIAEGDAERERIREELRGEIAAARAQVTELLEIREELGLDLQAALHGSSEALRTLQRRHRPAGDEPIAFDLEPTREPREMPRRPAAPLPQVPEAEPSTTMLDAGPVDSFARVLAFESELAALPGIEGVYVRRYAGRRIRASVHGAADDDLTTALYRLSSVTEVRSTAEGLSVTLRAEAHGPER